MSKIDVRTNAEQIMAQLRLDSREYSTAAVRALNHTIDKSRTQAIRSLREVYNVKASFLRGKAFFVRKATRNNLAAILVATGRPIPVIGFGARETRQGVSVAIKRGARKVIRSAFIARMPSGHSGVFLRDEKLPHIKERARHALLRAGMGHGKGLSKHTQGIRELFTTSVPGMMTAREVDKALEATARTTFITEMERQGRLIMGRRNG